MGCTQSINKEITVAELRNLPVCDWEPRHVAKWLEIESDGELRHLIPYFLKHEISGDLLCELTQEHLKKDLSAHKLRDQLKFIKARDNLLLLNNHTIINNSIEHPTILHGISPVNLKFVQIFWNFFEIFKNVRKDSIVLIKNF